MQCEIWNFVKLSVSFTLQSIGLSYILNRCLRMLLYHHAFTWKISGSMSYAGLPNLNGSLHWIKASYSLSPLTLLAKSVSIGKLSSPRWWVQVSQTSNFHFKTHILPLVTNITWFIFEDIGSFHTFSRKCLLNTHVWIAIGCLSILSKKKSYSMGKVVSLVPNSIELLFPEPHYFGIQQRSLTVLPIS